MQLPNQIVTCLRHEWMRPLGFFPSFCTYFFYSFCFCLYISLCSSPYSVRFFVPFQLISIAYAFKFRQQLSHMTELVWNGPLSENDLFLINSIDFDPRRQQPPNIPTTQESNLIPFPSSTCGYINEFCHEFGNRLTHLKSADWTY